MTATAFRRRLLLRTALGSALLGLAVPAQAQVTVAGTVSSTVNAPTIGTAGNTTTITATNSRTILNWNSLNHTSGNTLQYVVGSRGDIVLNRVLSGSGSINGTVASSIGSSGGATGGNIWFSAPYGLLIGANAVMNVGGLMATTLGVTDADFTDGNMSFSLSSAGASSVVVLGGAQLNVHGGTLALIAPVVTTDVGSVISDASTGNHSDVLFGSGDFVEITFAPDAGGDLDLLSWIVPAASNGASAASPVSLQGSVSAGNVYVGAVTQRLTTTAINITGTVTADGAAVNGDGNIVLVAGGNISNGAPGTQLGEAMNLTVSGALTSSRDITLSAPVGVASVSTAPTVGRDYRIEAQDFGGGAAFTPNFGSGTANNFTIVDTLGGLTVGGLSAPGTLSISSAGGQLTVNNTLTGTTGSVVLASDSAITLGANLNGAGGVTLTGPVTLGTNVTLASSGGGNIAISGALNGTTAGAQSLTVNTAGATSFAGGVGASTSLSSLTTNAGGTTSLTGDIFTSGAQTYNDAVTLTGATRLVSDNSGAISFASTVDGAFGLQVNTVGTGSFGGTVGGTTPLASLVTGSGGTTSIGASIRTSGSQVYNDAVSLADTATLRGTNATFNSGLTGNGNGLTLTLSSLHAVSGALTGLSTLTVNGTGTTQLSGTITTTGEQSYSTAVSLTNAAELTSTGGGNIGFSGTINGARTLAVNTSGATSFGGVVGGSTALTSLTTDADGTTSLGGNVTTTGAQTYNDAVTLTGSATLTSTGNAAIGFASTINGARALTVNTTGATSFGGAIGGTTALAGLITNAGGTTTLGNVTTTGGQTYGDAVTIGSNVTLSSTNSGDITFNGSIEGDGPGSRALTVNTAGVTRFATGVGTNATRLLSLTTDTGGLTSIGGDVNAETQTYGDAVGLTANATFAAGAGGTTFNGTLDGAHALTLDSEAIAFNGVVGGLTPLTSLSTTNFGAPIALNGGRIVTTGSLYLGVGALTLGANTDLSGGSITLGSVNGAFSLTATASSGLMNALGTIGGTTPLTALSLTGVSTRSTSATVTGDIGVTATNGDLVLTGGTLTAPNVVLSTSHRFTNQAGAGAVNASGRWLVYAGDPALSTFGGLDSNATAIWGSTRATRAPNTISGNRYVFAPARNLTVTSLDATKVYGETPTLTGYTVTGYQAGVANAYLGDSAATVGLTGAPALSSAGTAATATVAGGPYSITGAIGTLANTSGYGFSFADTGMLSVTPKALTLAATAGSKTYDGTTAATGTLNLVGVVGNDDVAATGTLTFADKNVGTGKSVTLTGAGLTGAAAGNYTLTLPAGLLADIVAKAITATVTANDKIYDGTTAAMGGLALGGVLTGDNVGVGGASFAFDSKNAGTRTVSVRGASLTGADAGNYVLTTPGTATATIARKAIAATVAADSKTYDGTTAATGRVTLSGVVAGDAVTAAGGSFTFADRNAGVGKTVAVTGVALDGVDAGNYTLTVPATTVADILRRALAVAADAATKAEGVADPTLGYRLTSGALAAGDALSGSLARTAGEAPGSYAIEQGSLSAGGNYDLTFTGATLTITPSTSSPVTPEMVPETVSDIIDRVEFRTDTGAVEASNLEVDDADYACAADDEACRAN